LVEEHGLAKDIQLLVQGGVYQLKRRVPVCYQGIEPRTVIRVSA
jgi:hypothetical protein